MAPLGSRRLWAIIFGLWTGAASAGEPAPGLREIQQVDFERHVMGLFGQMG
jgi:hypothetical protein